jgi:SAM-dependent methyltransferase
MTEEINQVRRRYENPHRWCSYDRWHTLNSLRVKSFINSTIRRHKIGYQSVTVNLGSGGVDYGVFTRKHFHVDIALTQLQRVRQAIAATIDTLPLRRSVADLVICVGEVLNYADPLAAIEEIALVMKPGSVLILEFESSRSLEFVFTRNFDKERLVIDTFFNGSAELITTYSPRLILGRLSRAGLSVTAHKTFHIFSSLALRFLQNERFSQLGGHLDPLAQIVPGLRWLGANHILSAIKV